METYYCPTKRTHTPGCSCQRATHSTIKQVHRTRSSPGSNSRKPHSDNFQRNDGHHRHRGNNKLESLSAKTPAEEILQEWIYSIVGDVYRLTNIPQLKIAPFWQARREIRLVWELTSLIRVEISRGMPTTMVCTDERKYGDAVVYKRESNPGSVEKEEKIGEEDLHRWIRKQEL